MNGHSRPTLLGRLRRVDFKKSYGKVEVKPARLEKCRNSNSGMMLQTTGAATENARLLLVGGGVSVQELLVFCPEKRTSRSDEITYGVFPFRRIFFTNAIQTFYGYQRNARNRYCVG